MVNWMRAAAPLSRTVQFVAGMGCCCFLALSADPAWKTTPISRWTAEDAHQVLADSPWAKQVAVALLPERSEAQLREGGKMGGGAARKHLGMYGDFIPPRTLQVRWESAPPVRAAELKAGEIGAPDWQGDYYAIAIYGVPGIAPSGVKLLCSDLKQTAVLKYGSKKEIKPARVEIDLLEGKLARVLYLFSRSAAVTGTVGPIEFASAIGRLYVAQSFETAEMQYQGKLAL